MSTAISGVKTKVCFPGNVSNISKVQDVQNMDSFSKVFDKTQGFEQTAVKEEFAKADNVESKTETKPKTETRESIQNHADIQKNKSSENLKEQVEEVKFVDELQETEAALEEAASALVGNIAEVFDVTVEEVEAVLETLGLTVLDLLNSENLTNVVLALNPDCDAMTLMTNEELFADLKSLMNLAQELKGQIGQEFNLSEEELNAVLNGLKEKTQIVNPEETQNLESEAETAVLVDVEEVAEDISLQSSVSETMVNSTKESETVSRGTESGKVENVDSMNQSNDSGIYKTENSEAAQNDSSGTKEDSTNTAAQNFAQNFVNQLAEAVENAEQTTTSYGVRGQDIINQITEQIRVHVTSETTEMELQLHPASLGNVKVQIASTGGVLTAVFTTENEAVKAALESQLVQLKENFAEQGLKVESVEVNVSAQGFERSLDQQEQEQNRFENSRSKKSTRRIRLDGIEENGDLLTEEMSGDDRIVADMMIRNGNTVDYMV